MVPPITAVTLNHIFFGSDNITGVTLSFLFKKLYILQAKRKDSHCKYEINISPSSLHFCSIAIHVSFVKNGFIVFTEEDVSRTSSSGMGNRAD